MEHNPYDFPTAIGSCTRCKHEKTMVIGSVCVGCLTPAEKKRYGVDQEDSEMED